MTHLFGVNPKLRTTKYSLNKLETLLYRMVLCIYRQLSHFVTIDAFDRRKDAQTDGRTDVNSKTVRMLRSRMVKMHYVS